MKWLAKQNPLKIVFYLVVVAVLNSCASIKSENIEKYIGLYQIVNSKCDGIQTQYNPCENTLFFEIVKGQFIGVENSQLAYVFWSGDPKIDAELQYTSHLIRNHQSSKISANKFWLNNEEITQEFLLFANGKLISYNVIYTMNDKKDVRQISYTLQPVQRGNLPNVRLNYPGNT